MRMNMPRCWRCCRAGSGIGNRAPDKDLTDFLQSFLRQGHRFAGGGRSEEHTSELQSLMRISYAVFCLKKKTLITLLLITLIFLFYYLLFHFSSTICFTIILPSFIFLTHLF